MNSMKYLILIIIGTFVSCQTKLPLRDSYYLTRIDKNTWASNLAPHELLAVMARQVSEKYEVLSVDRKNLVVATNWDKFLIRNRLFRNRLHIILFPIKKNYTEIVLRNEVEYHSEVRYTKDKAFDVWVPTQDVTKELYNIFKVTKHALSEF